MVHCWGLVSGQGRAVRVSASQVGAAWLPSAVLGPALKGRACALARCPALTRAVRFIAGGGLIRSHLLRVSAIRCRRGL